MDVISTDAVMQLMEINHTLGRINANLDGINTNLEKILEPKVEIRDEPGPDLSVQIPGMEETG